MNAAEDCESARFLRVIKAPAPLKARTIARFTTARHNDSQGSDLTFMHIFAAPGIDRAERKRDEITDERLQGHETATQP
jgi:hypothetical protein